MEEEDYLSIIARVRGAVNIAEKYESIHGNGSLPVRSKDALNHAVLRAYKLERRPKTLIGCFIQSIRISWIDELIDEFEHELHRSIKS